MINKPSDYDSAVAEVAENRKGMGRLPLDNYICKIVDATPHTSRTGNESIKVNFDIAQGEYTDYFMHRLAKDIENNPNAKWKQAGTTYFSLGNAGRLKATMEAIEQSNRGYKWNWDEKSLRGKVFAGNFSGEEKSYNGHDYVELKLARIYPVDEFDKMPKAWMKKPKAQDDGFGAESTQDTFGGTVSTSDEIIPF